VIAPGIYPDLSNEEYHADPALSSSGARLLLPPSSPAKYRWARDHGEQTKRVYELGSAAHQYVLGNGTPVRHVPGDRWDTKVAKQQVADVRAAGMIPVKLEELEMLAGMAAALREHPLASALLDPEAGVPEVSMFWDDAETGVRLRCRPDWLPYVVDGLMLLPDYKTARSADPNSWARNAASFGYPQQDAWYRDAVITAGLAEEVRFLFVLQEREPPYLVSVVELEPEDVAIGRTLNRQAIEVFADCLATDSWPAYTDPNEATRVAMPRWYRYAHEEIA
jgi:hypothetical protein